MKRLSNILEIESLLDEATSFIFDFDGTIADTERYHWMAYNVCLEEFDIVLTQENIDKYIGNSEVKIYEMIKSDFNIEFDDEKFMKKRLQNYLELVKTKNLRTFSYFDTLLSKYHECTFNILSSQRIEIIDELLTYWNIKERFKTIVSVSDGKKTKNDVLGNVIDYFGTDNVLLFEDTNRVLQIAKSKGIKTIGVEHGLNRLLVKDCDYLIGEE